MEEQFSWPFSNDRSLSRSPLARTPHEQTALERHIEATDRQVDALVYELYGLTEEEIAIVDGGA